MSESPTTLPAPRNARGGPVRSAQVDVPGMPDVYFAPDSDNFYSRSHSRGMGDKFYREHIHLMRSVTNGP